MHGAPAGAMTPQSAPATEQVFFTKRVNDPNLVPMLLAHGVRFGAVKVGASTPNPHMMPSAWLG